MVPGTLSSGVVASNLGSLHAMYFACLMVPKARMQHRCWSSPTFLQYSAPQASFLASASMCARRTAGLRTGQVWLIAAFFSMIAYSVAVPHNVFRAHWSKLLFSFRLVDVLLTHHVSLAVQALAAAASHEVCLATYWAQESTQA